MAWCTDARCLIRGTRLTAAPFSPTLQGGTLKKTMEDGRQSDLVFETGMSYWMEARPHTTSGRPLSLLMYRHTSRHGVVFQL
jgi:hypothetical protein